jgi:hypothetical protein
MTDYSWPAGKGKARRASNTASSNASSNAFSTLSGTLILSGGVQLILIASGGNRRVSFVKLVCSWCEAGFAYESSDQRQLWSGRQRACP